MSTTFSHNAVPPQLPCGDCSTIPLHLSHDCFAMRDLHVPLYCALIGGWADNTGVSRSLDFRYTLRRSNHLYIRCSKVRGLPKPHGVTRLQHGFFLSHHSLVLRAVRCAGKHMISPLVLKTRSNSEAIVDEVAPRVPPLNISRPTPPPPPGVSGDLDTIRWLNRQSIVWTVDP